MSADTMIQRLAGRPRSVDPEQRTVELVIASEAPIQGLSLTCSRDAVQHAEVIPVLLSHENHTGAMCGRIERLRFERGQVLGLARFSDAPAADAGWELAQAGCNVSVGAMIDPDAIEAGRDHDIARKWRLVECSLVPAGADPACYTRSLSSTPMTTPSTAPNVTVHDTPATAEVADLRRQVQRLENEQMIRATAEQAGLRGDAVDQIVQRHGDDAAAACQEIVRVIAARQPKFNSMVLDASGGADDSLSGVIARKLKGERGMAPLSVILRDSLRINETNPERIIRAAMSTSDFQQALLDAGERELLDAYDSAAEGCRALALRRELSDFREVSMLRASAFAGVEYVGEGGEYKAGKFFEEDAASLKAAQYGSLVKVTRVALANDDLSIFGRMVEEMGRAAARKEATELAARLADITFNAANSLNGQADLDINAIAAAVLLLRRQSDVGGNPVAFDPDLLVIAPEEERHARSLLANYQPNVASNVMPFSNLRLEVDHNLAGGVAYLSDSRYPSLGIGQVGTGPSISEEEEFTTGSLMLRVQHDFGTCAVDGRSIVRIAL